jgi:hypothetical protein
LAPDWRLGGGTSTQDRVDCGRSHPKRLPCYKRYQGLVARILLKESAVVCLLGHVNSDLDRRARLCGMLPKISTSCGEA